MPYIIIAALDLLCIMHCMKRGGKSTWIFVILGIPILGALLYLFVEVRPDWERGRQRDRANANPLRHRPASQPERKPSANQAKGDLHPRLQAAREYMQQGQADQAAAIYRQSLAEGLQHDPELLTCLAQAEYAQQHYSAAIDCLNQVRALSDYKPTFVRLLLAMCYSSQGESEKATRLYETLLKSDPQPEVKVRYALYLETSGQSYRSQQLLKEVVNLEPACLESHDREWLQQAESLLAKT